MELKNSALRSRVFAAALALGLVIGAYVYLSSSGVSVVRASEAKSVSAPTTPSGEAHQSPGGSFGLRPNAPSGISFSTVPTATELESAWKQSTIRLKYLDHCLQSQNCQDFDSSEPYSYDLDVSRQMARELSDFKTVALEWQKQKGGDLPAEAQTVARYFLATGDDYVKEAALKLIEHAPLSKENVNAAFQAVEGSTSGPLMAVFMKSQLTDACAQDEHVGRCLTFIKHSMQVGGENLQRTFARYSLNVCNPSTMPLLTEIEARQNPRSKTREFMRFNRQECERMQKGG